MRVVSGDGQIGRQAPLRGGNRYCPCFSRYKTCRWFRATRQCRFCRRRRVRAAALDGNVESSVAVVIARYEFPVSVFKIHLC